MSLRRLAVVAGLVAFVSCGAQNAQGRGGPPPAHLPSGECGDRWERPTIAVGFGDVVERPYEGFRLTAMREAASAYESSFAELFVNKRDRALRVSFVFTRDPNKRAEELREITAYPGNVRVLRGCYSLRALLRIQEVVSRELFRRNPPLRLDSSVEYTSIDVKLNRVEVGLKRYSQNDERKIVRRYGSVVHVVPRDQDISPDGD